MLIDEVLLKVIGAAKYPITAVYDDTYTNIEEAISANASVVMYGIKDIDLNAAGSTCHKMRTKIVLGIYLRRDTCLSACNLPEGTHNWGEAMAQAERKLWWDMVRLILSIYNKLTAWQYATAGGTPTIMQLANIETDPENTNIDLEKLGGAFGTTANQLIGLRATFSVLWSGLAANVLFDENELYP